MYNEILKILPTPFSIHFYCYFHSETTKLRNISTLAQFVLIFTEYRLNALIKCVSGTTKRIVTELLLLLNSMHVNWQR